MRLRDALKTTDRPRVRRRGSGTPERSTQDTGAFHVARARDAGGPQDAALYRCACGHEFRAPVSAEVACPVCGSEQAW